MTRKGSGDETDVSHLIVSDYGRFLGKKSERLTVSEKGKVLEEVPLRDLEQVTIASMGVSMSTDALAACIEFGVPVNFLTSAGKPYALVTSPELTGTVITRREQLKAYDDERGVHLAKCFVKGKINNQACLVKYFAKHRKTDDAYGGLMDKAKAMERLEEQVDDVSGAIVDDVRARLLNLEGRAAAIYWSAVGSIAVGDEFEGRDHRGADDPFNACLNYGYGVLYSQVWGSLILAGLEPFGGFLHVDRPGKPSLVLDMVEEFRAPCVDRSVIALMSRGWRPEFEEEGHMTVASRREVAGAVLERLEGKERYEGQKHKLSGVILAQARKIAVYLRGEGKYEAFRSTW
jgi:CRISPR-associated protein Cas1